MELNGTLQSPGNFTLREPSRLRGDRVRPTADRYALHNRNISFSCREMKTDSLVVMTAAQSVRPPTKLHCLPQY